MEDIKYEKKDIVGNLKSHEPWILITISLEEPDSAHARKINQRGQVWNLCKVPQTPENARRMGGEKDKTCPPPLMQKQNQAQKKVDHTPMTDDGRNEKRRGEKVKKITKK